MTNAKLWLVYSREHNAFWKPNECGYTTLVTEAGRYSHERALEICAGANYGLPIRESHEVPVVAPEAVDLLCSMLAALKGVRDFFTNGFEGTDYYECPAFDAAKLLSVQGLIDAVIAKAESQTPNCGYCTENSQSMRDDR